MASPTIDPTKLVPVFHDLSRVSLLDTMYFADLDVHLDSTVRICNSDKVSRQS